jgi:Cu(I)/Ag(I) efflux system membrane fusion protein
MKRPGIAYLITFIAVCIALTAGLLEAASLSDADKQFLSRYEKVRSALAADDLGAAKTAAGDLGDEGVAAAKSTSLKEARAAFEKLSDRAKQLAAGQSGFYVVHCPMLNKDWVQTSEKIANPYYGKEMATCGEIKK